VTRTKCLKLIKVLKDIVFALKAGVVADTATPLHSTSNGGSPVTAHYAPQLETPANFSANISRQKSAQSLAPLLVAPLSKTRGKILGERRVMETTAACDACLPCVLTKQYWWADMSPFDMISPPFSTDSELPPQNKHLAGTHCSASAIMQPSSDTQFF
jgi:hypothetical protein